MVSIPDGILKFDDGTCEAWFDHKRIGAYKTFRTAKHHWAKEHGVRDSSPAPIYVLEASITQKYAVRIL